VLVLMRHADDPQPIVAEGEWHGEIIDTPRGEGGFGYDPYFLVPGPGSPRPNCRTRRRTAARIAARRWRNSSRACAAGRDSDHPVVAVPPAPTFAGVPGLARRRRWRCTCIGRGASRSAPTATSIRTKAARD
jgi:hypothetical protein